MATAAKPGKSTKSTKVDPDVCVYVWEQASPQGAEWAWVRFDLEPNQDAATAVESCKAAGKAAVIGKVSIGAPEGPPADWVADVGAVEVEEAPLPLTRYICISKDHFGTGDTPTIARREMIKAGASQTGTCIAYELPDGARGAHVSEGSVTWYGDAEGDPVPVVEFRGSKRINLRTDDADEAKPTPTPAPDPTLLTDAEKARVQEVADEEAQMVATDAVNDAPAPKPVKAPKQPKPAKVKKEPKVEEAKQDPETGHDVVGEANEAGVATGPSNFLLFIGGTFYTKDKFIEEAAQLGISRRMPSHRIPRDLVAGQSRVYVAAEGQRKAEDGVPTSEVFGYFIPSRVEFIDTTGSEQYAQIVAALKLRPDTRIVGNTSQEPPRECGKRQEGGTYIVVDKADSPLHLLDKPASYVGNHFRGMMRLDAAQSTAFATGAVVTTMVDEVCMTCGAAFKCAPDGHERAERERRRMAKGGEQKWSLDCAKCRKDKAKTKRDADKAEVGADPTPETPAVEESADDADDFDPMAGTD